LLFDTKDMSTFLSDAAAPLHTNTVFVRGRSQVIQSLNALVEEIARTNIPVLLMGESGTGKEVYGRMIHRLSLHGHRPLKKVNCRAVDQAEFFATLKSGLKDGVGHCESEPQTLFLDSIDDLDLESQRILLSLLSDSETEGSSPNRTRIIASTSQNLEKEVDAGRFRRELYFRINGVCLRLPPLRDRKEDIHAFLAHFLAKHATELGREVPTLSGEEMEFLMPHDWPGNVRELENLARRIVLLGDSKKAIEELCEPRKETAQKEDQSFSLKAAARTASRRAERDLIAKALERTHWNRKRAAQELQISYKSLLYKIKQTGLEEKGS
jgi:two-component system, NtrC family, response regulator AtoC